MNLKVNSVDPDQMSQDVLADLDVHCMPWDNSDTPWSKGLMNS
jgi:hypothetical protein